MLFSLFASVLIFVVVCLGLGWPVAATLRLDAGEKILATVALSFTGTYLVAWSVYVLALPPAALWAIPVAAIGGALLRWPNWRTTCRAAPVRALLVGQLIVTAWCITALATIFTYSGGGWAADWYEHWERTRFFLDHSPLETRFLGHYAVTARPPLGNVVIGAFLAVTRGDFAHYQLVSTLLASLAFLPAALLARRWGTAASVAVMAALLLVNPSFLQNATFAWTKLPAAFFVLTGLYFFLRARDPDAPPAAGPLTALCLAAGALTHYSAVPYCLVLGLAWLGLHRPPPATRWWHGTGGMAVIAGLILTTWFGWAIAVCGPRETFLANSTVMSADARQGNQLVKIALNLFDTVVPHFLRSFDRSLVAQTSAWGAWRDWFFQVYQLNLPLGVGSVAGLAIVREVIRRHRTATKSERAGWAASILATIVLGIAVHGQRDHWGLAHICLQPLVLLGLAFLAARWEQLSTRWRRALVAGAAVDLACGIVLHLGVESLAWERWLAPGRSMNDTLRTLSEPAQMNLIAKVTHHLAFFADALAAPLVLPGAIAAGLLAFACWRVRPSPAAPPSAAHET